jgi:hypothetical protein
MGIEVLGNIGISDLGSAFKEAFLTSSTAFEG